MEEKVKQGRERYTGSRLSEHDERLNDLDEGLNDLRDRIGNLEGPEEPVEVPEHLSNFVVVARAEDISDVAIVAAIFEAFGLGAFSDREIAVALELVPSELDDGLSDPGDESGSDEAPEE